MDANRFHQAHERLQALDERMTYRVRPRPHSSHYTLEQLEERYRDLAEYTLTLKEILGELFEAIAGRPASPDG